MDNNRKIIFKKILDNLEVISEQANTISNYEGNIPKIELDIIMSYVRDVYDELHSLDKINNSASAIHTTKILINKPVDEEIAVVEKEPTKEISTNEGIEPSGINIRFEAPKVSFSNITPVKENITEEIFIENKKEENFAEIKPQEKVVKKPIVKESSLDLFGTPSIADKFKDEKPSLNDLLVKDNDKNTIASKISLQTITDLKSAIGINDKFKMINDLFSGNSDEYNSFIQSVNNANNHIEAEGFIEEYAINYHWQDNNDTLQILKNFIQRRFI